MCRISTSDGPIEEHQPKVPSVITPHNNNNNKMISTTSSATTTTTTTTILLKSLTELWDHKYKILLFIIILIPICMILTILIEATRSIFRYRMFFGKAPIPISPSFGVVVVGGHGTTTTVARSDDVMNSSHSNQRQQCSSTSSNSTKYTQLPNVPNTIPHAYKTYPTHDDDASTKYLHEILNHATNQQQSIHIPPNKNDKNHKSKTPLRILVMGDSIALGVGVKKSCTPVFPEVVAKVLSKQTGGRPVFWTSYAESGVSTSWVAREIELHNKNNNIHQNTHAKRKEEESSSSTTATILSNINMNDPNTNVKYKYLKLLQHHQNLHYQTSLGEYDVVILFNGTNDVKRLVLPFVKFQEDDIEGDLHNEGWKALSASEKFRALMKRILIGLGHDFKVDEMKRTTAADTNSRDHQEQLQQDPEQQSLITTATTTPTTSVDYGSTEEEEDEHNNSYGIIKMTNNGYNTNYNDIETAATTTNDHLLQEERMYFRKPAKRNVILPSPAIRNMMRNIASPVSQNFAVFMTNIMENEKKKVIVNTDTAHWLTPPDAEAHYYDDYINHVGVLTNLYNDDTDVLLNLISCSVEECMRVEETMRDFHESLPNVVQENTEKNEDSSSDGRDNSPLYSADHVHPSDRGYDFYGRYVGLLTGKILMEQGLFDNE